MRTAEFDLSFADLHSAGLSEEDETRLIAAVSKVLARTSNVSEMIVLAIETGLSEQELARLKLSDICGDFAEITDPKAFAVKKIQLSKRALKVIKGASAQPKKPNDTLFELTQDRLVRGFKKACDKAEIEDLVFHDLRHEAASRMAKIYQAHELAKIFGWKTIQMAMRYYHPDALDFVAKLDAAGASA